MNGKLNDIQEKAESLRRACFREDTPASTGHYSLLAGGLGKCRDAYAGYLAAAGRYGRAKLIRASCLAEGKVEYRLERFQAYVREELPAADSVLAVMSGGWYGCVAPVLEEAQSLESRLDEWEEEPLPGREAMQKQLLKRYFTNSVLFEFIRLPEELEACRKRLSDCQTRQELEEREKEARALSARYEKLRDACTNRGSRAVLADVDRVTAELEASTKDLNTDLGRCEKLLRRVRECAAKLRGLPLYVEAGEDGLYPEAPQRLAELKKAYAAAAESVKEGSRFESDRSGKPEV